MSDMDWIDCVRWSHGDQSMDVGHVMVGQLIDFALRSSYETPIVTSLHQTRDFMAGGYLAMYPGALGSIARLRTQVLSENPEFEANRVALLSEVVRDLCRKAFDQGAEIVQAITPIEMELDSLTASPMIHETREIRLITDQEKALASELKPVAVLVQMECKLSRIDAVLKNAQHNAEPTDLVFRPFESIPNRQWEEIIESTYVETLDVPELNGIRSIDQTLKGYAFACGQEPKPWWLVEHAGQIIGCLLLTPISAVRMELTYLGIVPAARGKQFANRMMHFLMGWVARQSVPTIQLAVDRRNIPALHTYFRYGFQPTGFVQAWVRAAGS